VGQYDSNPGNRAYCYAELDVSPPVVMAATITSTHVVYPQRHGQAELALVAWSNTMTVYPQTVRSLQLVEVTDLSINPTQRRVTLLMQTMMLLLG